MKKIWTQLSRMSASLVYGLSVTLVIALYYAIVKHGDVMALPRFIKMTAMTLTPYMMVGYGISRWALPDVPVVTRPRSLMLPALEGGLAVLLLTLLFVWGELRDPYLNAALDVARVILSALGARWMVRRTFRW